MASRLTLVVTAADKDSANQWMKANVDREGGDGTFTSPYSDNGLSITHYVASGQWSEQQAAALIEHFGADACEGEPQDVLGTRSLSPYTGPLS